MREKKRAASFHPAREQPGHQLNFIEAITSNTVEGIYTLDREGRVTFLNPAAEQMLGWTQDELLGKQVHEVIHYQHADSSPYPHEVCPLLGVLHSGQALRGHEDTFFHKSGQPFPVSCSSGPILAAGRIMGAVLAFHDISERKRAEAALREAQAQLERKVEERTRALTRANQELQAQVNERRRAEASLRDTNQTLQAIVEASPLAIIALDLRGLVTRWNRAAERIFGWSEAEVVGGPHPIVPPDKKEEFDSIWRDVRAGQHFTEFETVRLRKDGSLIDVSLSHAALRNAQGEVSGVIVVGSEISERKRIERALRESEARFRHVAQSGMIGIIFWQADGLITDANDTFLQMVGYPREDLAAGKIRWDEMTPEEYRHLDLEGLAQFDRDGVIAPFEKEYVRKDGSRVPVLLGGALYAGAGGQGVSFVLDMTERKGADRARRESQRMIEQIAQTMPNVLYVFDLVEQRNIYANAQIARMLGYTAEEVQRMGSSMLQCLMSPEEFTRVVELLRRFDTAQDGEVLESEYRMRHASGSEVWLWSREIIFARDAAGRPQQILGVAHDITERRLAEENLRRSETSLANAQRIAHIGNWDWDVEKNELHWSEEVYRIFGLRAEASPPDYERFISGVSPADRARVQRAVNEALAHISPYNLEHRVVRPNGEERVVHEIGEVSFDERGRPVRMTGTVQDITERKQVESRLKESEELFRQMAESIREVFWIADTRQEKILYVSPAYAELWGRSCASLYADPASFLEPLHPADRKQFDALYKSDLETEVSFEYRLFHPDGSLRWVRGRSFPVKDEEGKVYRRAGIAEDITDRKLAAEQVQASLEEKEVLLKEIHHRVKNNLQVVSSLLNFQARHISDEATRALFRESQDRVKTIALIHEKLYQAPDFSHVNFVDYVRSLVSDLSYTYKYKTPNVSLQVEVSLPSVSLEIAVPCGLIISELVSNALKYAFPAGQPGEILVSLHARGEQIALTVKDNGIGFSPDLEAPASQSLGLYLVRALTRQLGGVVEFTTPGGTQCQITFPA